MSAPAADWAGAQRAGALSWRGHGVTRAHARARSKGSSVEVAKDDLHDVEHDLGRRGAECHQREVGDRRVPEANDSSLARAVNLHVDLRGDLIDGTCVLQDEAECATGLRRRRACYFCTGDPRVCSKDWQPHP